MVAPAAGFYSTLVDLVADNEEFADVIRRVLEADAENGVTVLARLLSQDSIAVSEPTSASASLLYELPATLRIHRASLLWVVVMLVSSVPHNYTMHFL